MDTKKYKFIEYKPHTRVLNSNEVTLSARALYFNDACVSQYLKNASRKIFLKVLIDADNKIAAIKFYNEEEIGSKENIIRITKVKRGYHLNCISILKILRISNPKNPIKLKAVKSDDGFMLIYFDNVV